MSITHALDELLEEMASDPHLAPELLRMKLTAIRRRVEILEKSAAEAKAELRLAAVEAENALLRSEIRKLKGPGRTGDADGGKE